MTEHVKIEQANGILTLTFARPDKKNAITNLMYGALADAINAAETDPATRVIVLRGEGDMFTAGNDVGEFAAMATGNFRGERHVSRFVDAIARSTRPMVAAVQGRAVGIGTTMLLHCDLVYAARSAVFTAPFVNLALVPEAASSLLLPRRIGHAKAAELFLLGGRLDAAQAETAGLVTAVFDDAALRDEAMARARSLALQAPEAVRTTKMLMKRGDEPIAERVRAEAEQFAVRLTSPELREAVKAFTEKRRPDFGKSG